MQKATAEGFDRLGEKAEERVKKLKDIEVWRDRTNVCVDIFKRLEREAEERTARMEALIKGSGPDAPPPPGDLWDLAFGRAVLQVSTADRVEEGIPLGDITKVCEAEESRRGLVWEGVGAWVRHSAGAGLGQGRGWSGRPQGGAGARQHQDAHSRMATDGGRALRRRQDQDVCLRGLLAARYSAPARDEAPRGRERTGERGSEQEGRCRLDRVAAGRTCGGPTSWTRAANWSSTQCSWWASARARSSATTSSRRSCGRWPRWRRATWNAGSLFQPPAAPRQCSLAASQLLLEAHHVVMVQKFCASLVAFAAVALQCERDLSVELFHTLWVENSFRAGRLLRQNALEVHGCRPMSVLSFAMQCAIRILRDLSTPLRRR